MADQDDLPVLQLPHDCGDIFSVVAHRPVGAIFLGGAVSGEVDRYYGVFRLERLDLGIPVGRVAGPTVDQYHRGLALSPDAIVDVYAVGSQGNLW